MLVPPNGTRRSTALGSLEALSNGDGGGWAVIFEPAQ